jgi:hypothetical protein
VGCVSDRTPDHPGALLGLLADEDRLRCLSAVMLGAPSEAEVATATHLGVRAVKRALGRLVSGGLVAQAADGTLQVTTDRFREAAKVASRMRLEIRPEDLGARPEQAAVLRGFLDDGRLVSIPVQRAKRLVVLDFLAQQFDPGKTYPERDVNAVLGRFHPDYAALRRYLVDEEFLERREGFYWRAGGSFPVEPVE